MHSAGHVARPEIEIPPGTDVDGIPTGADQGRGAVVVVLENELAAVESDMAVGFGIGWLFGDVEDEFLVRDKFRHALLDHDAVTENALPIGPDEVTAIGGLRRIRKAEPEDPV